MAEVIPIIVGAEENAVCGEALDVGGVDDYPIPSIPYGVRGDVLRVVCYSCDVVRENYSTHLNPTNIRLPSLRGSDMILDV